MGTADRANLYNDVFALADAALLDYTVALNFSRTLVSEAEYVPWTGVKGNLRSMQRLLETTPAFQPFTVMLTVHPFLGSHYCFTFGEAFIDFHAFIILNMCTDMLNLH